MATKALSTSPRAVYRRKFREANPELCKARSKAESARYRARNPEEKHAHAKSYYERNRELVKAKSRKWYNANKTRVRALARERNLKACFGITGAERAAILKQQDGRCAICRNPFRSSRDTHTDHNHRTGAFRALLCSKCNHGLGHVEKDSGAWLALALEYVWRHR